MCSLYLLGARLVAHHEPESTNIVMADTSCAMVIIVTVLTIVIIIIIVNMIVLVVIIIVVAAVITFVFLGVFCFSILFLFCHDDTSRVATTYLNCIRSAHNFCHWQHHNSHTPNPVPGLPLLGLIP